MFQNHLTKIHIETDHLNEENLNDLICKHIHDATQLSIPFVKLSKFIFTLPPDIREKIKEKNKMRREISKKKNKNNTALNRIQQNGSRLKTKNLLAQSQTMARLHRKSWSKIVETFLAKNKQSTDKQINSKQHPNSDSREQKIRIRQIESRPIQINS